MHDEIRPSQPGVNLEQEGQMARSELYRAAKMSIKLFQMIQDGQDLEAWVQAKITKSADYLDSIYHYMEYQMKFGDGSSAVSVDDIASEADAGFQQTEVSEEDDEINELDESMNYEQKLKALLEGAVKKEKATKEAVDKSKIPAAQRKAKGGDWKVSRADLEKEANKSPTTKAGLAQKKKDVGVAEGISTTWEVSYDYGPHMTKTATVNAGSEEEARAKVKKATEKKGLRIMINSVRPAEQGVAEGFPTVADAKAKAEKEKASKGTGKFDKKDTTTGTQYTRKAKTFTDGGDDKDTKAAKKKAKQTESMVQAIVRRVVEAKKANKKPDADGDGVPDWADKKPGADDAGGKPKKGVNPFAKKDAKVDEAFPTVADAKAKAEKEKASKGTGKFDKKDTTTGTQYTRKASTFKDGGDDKDTKDAKKKAKTVKESEDLDYMLKLAGRRPLNG